MKVESLLQKFRESLPAPHRTKAAFVNNPNHLFLATTTM
jgi:hypothetical protein